jgi:YD repeat-containing protein
MVAIVAGQGLGLFNTSGGVLGGAGQLGVGAQGRSGEKVLVNASTGNLVVQQQDEWLVGVGPDVGVGRTYNSLGGGTDDNGDNWRLGLSRRIVGLVGTVNTAGSAITRVGEDGAEVVYSWDATRAAYVSKNGAGSFDTLSLAGGFWTWTDGDTQVKETYQVVSGVDAKLLRVVDPDGNKIELTYGGGLTSYLVTEIATWSASAATGEKVAITYDTAAGNTSDILSITTRYLSAGVAQPDVKRVSYTYEPYTKAGQAARRLKTVTVDLTPQNSTDNATAGTTYTSTYTYVDASSSRLASLTQSDGSKLDFAYDAATSRIVSIKESVGAQVRETKFDYSVAGVTKVTDALGQITELSYEMAAGQNQYQLKSIKSPAVGGVSQVQSFAYDANGNVVSVTDARGSVTTYGYDANGNRVYERDAQNNVVRRSFSATNQLLTQTSYLDLDPDGAGVGEPTQALSTRYVYETAAGKTHQLRFAISAEGRVTEYSYNAAGQISRTFAYAAGTYGTAALAPAQVPALADMVAWAGAQSKAGSQRVDYTYDSRGQLDRKSTFGSVDAAGNGVLDGTQSVAQYVYDQAGNLLKQVDALGGITQYAYDGLNRVISQRDAAGNVTSTLYTDALRQGKVSMANGLAVVSTYDASGRVVSVSRTDAAVALGTTSYVYDALGRQRAVTGPLGEKSYTLYDAANRKVGEIDAEGALTEYIYNGNNQVVRSVQYATKVDPAKLVGDGSALVLDGATGVRPVVNGTADRVSRNIYDKAGRLTISIDALGFVQERRYDGAGRLQETLAYATALSTQLSTLAASTQELSSSRGAILAYDPATATTLTLSVPTSAADRRVRNFYRADGQLIGQLDGESRYTAYAYDGVGQLVKTTRYANTLVGSLPDGNVPPAVVAAATGVVYVLSNAINDQVTQSLYNGRGQLVGKLDAEGYYSSYQYDAAGNQVLSVRYANRVVGVFDGKTAPVVVAVGAALPASGSYVQASTEDQKLINAYDPNGRLIRSESQPTGVINTYQYDSVGNLLKSVRALGQPEEQSQQKRYDKLGRLTAELSAQGSKALAQLLTATPTATQAQIDEVWASYGLRHQYDLSGRRTSTIEPNGVDGAGIKSVYYYDKVGRLTHSINALGEVVQYDYNSFGEKLVETKLGTRLSSTVLAALSGGLASGLGTSVSSVLNASLDTKTLQEYDRRGQLSKRTDALGLFVMSQYNAFGELSTRWDRLSSGLNETTAYSYNRAGQLLQTQELLAQRTLRQVVDAFGRITQSVDALGKAASFVYDRLGRQVTNVDRTGVYHQTSYDAFGRTLISRDGQFNATTYTYDSANRKVTVTTPEGIQSVTESNRLGQSVKVTDGRGNATIYSYNADGQLLSTTAPAGLGTSTIGYDKAGRVIETRDARGVLTRTTYDAASRVLTRTQDPTGLNLSTQYRYDAKGQAIWSRDANGVWTQKEYDLKGQLKAVTVDPKRGPDWVSGAADDNPAGLALRTQYTFDAQGRTLSVIEGAGTAQARTVQYVYDAAGRRTQEIVDPAGLKLITSYTYDLNNNVTSRTDAKGQITSYIYDAENRQTYVVDATGAVTKRAYDREGRVSTSTAYATRIAVAAGINEAYVTARLVSVPARDQVTRSVYDRNGRLSHRIDAMNYVTRFEYDGAGNVVKQTRYATAASSVTLSTSLGALITWAAPVVSTSTLDRVEQTSYDALGRAVYSVDAAGGVTQRTFDANGNLTKTTRFANAMTGTLATNGVPAVVADAARDQSSYSVYDNANRAIFGVDALNFVTASTYDAAGRVLSQTRYGTALASYSTGAVPTPVANAALDARISYEYDKAGRNTKVSDALGSATLKVYDAVGRVTDMTQAHGTADASTTRYVYDAAGRVTQQVTAHGKAEAATTSYVLDALGQQTSVTAAGYTTQQVFDGAGRVISTISPLSWTTSTEYDAFGNAVKVTDPNGNAGYFYFDQLNRSTWQIDPQGYALSTRFDAFGQAEEITRYASVVTGTPVTTLTPAAYALAADATAAGSSLYVLRNATQDATTRIEHDKLGRQTRLIDAEGKAESMSYDVLGNKTGYVNKLGGAYVYTHDVLGRVLTEKAPVQVKGADGLLKDVITRFAYDAQGNVTQKTEASGLSEQRITLYGYDLNNQLKTTTGEAMSTYSVAGGDKTETPVETRSYDRRGNLIELKAADGARTLSYWDANNRKVAELNALGKLTTWSYAADGKTTAQRIYGDALALPATAGGSAPVPVNAANVRETIFTYDGNRRLIETRQSNITHGSRDASAASAYAVSTGDITVTKHYDAAGNVVKEVDARGNATFSHYDKLGRKLFQVDAERYVTQWAYDAAGNVLSQSRYANAIPVPAVGAVDVVAVEATVASLLAAIPGASDKRVVEYSYDRLNRKTEERTLGVLYTEVNASSGVPVEKTGTVSTRFEYNALGAVTRQTKLSGADYTAAIPGVINALRNEPVSVSLVNHYDGLVDGKTGAELPITGASHKLTLNLPDTSGLGLGALEIQFRMDAASGLQGASGKVSVPSTQRYAEISLAEASVGAGTTDVPARSYSYTLLKKVPGAADRVLGTFSGTVAARLRTNGNWQDVTSHSALSGVGNVLAVADQAASTAKVVLLTRRSNSGSGWTVSDVPQLKTGGVKVPGRFELDWSTWARGDYDFRYFAFDANNTLLNAQQGNMALSDAAAFATQTPVSLSAQGHPFLDASGQLNLAGMNVAGTKLTLAYRSAGSAGAYTSVALTADATGGPGWFKWPTSALAGAFEYTYELSNASGTLLSKGSGALTVGNANSVSALQSNSGPVSIQEVTDMSYDAQGRLTRTQAPTFVDWENASVRPTSDIEYNALGLQSRLIQRGKNDATEADDRITSYTYGKNGLRVAETDPQGNVTNYAFDVAQRITRRDITRKDADGTINNDRLTVVYDLAGQQTEQITASMVAAATAYTQLKSEQTGYNVYGEVTLKGENGGAQRKIEYDNAGRVWRSNATDNGAVKVYYYDANGNATLELTSSEFDLSSAAVLANNSAASLSAALSGNKANPKFNLYDKLNRLVDSYEPSMNQKAQAATLASRTETITNTTRQDPFAAGAISVHKNKIPLSSSYSQTGGGRGTQINFSYKFNTGVPTETVYGRGRFRVKVSVTVRSYGQNKGGPWVQSRVGTFDSFFDPGVGGISAIVSMPGSISNGAMPGDGTIQYDYVARSEVFQVTGHGEVLVASLDESRGRPSSEYGVYVPEPSKYYWQAPLQKIKVYGQQSSVNRFTFKIRQGSTGAWRELGINPYVENGAPISGAYWIDWAGIAYGDYSFQYEGFDSNGAKLVGASGVIGLGDAPVILSFVADARPDLVTYTYKNYLDWALGAESAFDLSVHRKQVYNAYGENTHQIGYKRDANNQVVEVATVLTYNALGKLIEKKDPAASITLENGSKSVLNPTTRYYYDAMGRLVGSKDANGNLNTLTLLAGSSGQQALSTAEFHADRRLQAVAGVETAREGVKRNQYDVFGQLKRSANENWDGVAAVTPYATTYDYNRNGQLIAIDRPGAADETYEVDSLGQRTATTLAPSANDGGVRYRETTKYDALGRVLSTTSAGNRSTNYSYAWVAAIAGGGGWRVTTTSADGTTVDDTDTFGRIRWHKDHGNHAITYRYNAAGLLSGQTSLATDGVPTDISAAGLIYTGQSISFSYYGNGLLKDTVDNARLTWSKYRYDDRGNRVFEGYARNFGTDVSPIWEYYQYSEATYDDAGRLTRVWDPKSDINYEYDAVGNRRRVFSKYHDGAQGGLQTQDYWYKYDNMNRFVLTMGSLSATNEIVQGANGRLVGYDRANQRLSAVTAKGTETYSYDAEGYLQEVKLNGSRIAWRDSDARGNVMVMEETSPDGVTRHTYAYDADNNLKTDKQELLKPGQTAYKLVANTTNTLLSSGALDISVRTEYKDDGSVNNTVNTDIDYVYWDGAKQSQISIKATNPSNPRPWEPGSSTQSYDLNGHIERSVDRAGNRHFYYSTDADGRVLRREEVDGPDAKPSQQNRVASQRSALYFQNYYFFNGREVGTVSNDPSAILKDYGQALAQGKQGAYYERKAVLSADFDQNYQPIGTNYPGRTASSYTVSRTGETLQNIAMALWGDGSLWYLIAEANGLSGNSTLAQGQRLVIPNKVTNIHNNTQTSRPYDAAQAMGDISPTLPDPPPPPGRGGCGGLGMILMIVVAVVATVFTAGAATVGLAGSFGSIMSAGATALGAGLAGGLSVGGFMLAGAVGSAASQLVGMATGDVKKFSWSAVAMGAIGGGVSAGVSSVVGSTFGAANSFGSVVARSAISNTLTQGVAVAVGLQEKFSWTGVAASAMGSAVGWAAADALGSAGNGLFGQTGGKLVRDTITGMASGAASSVVQGRRPYWASLAVSSFGNALGDAVVGAIAQGDGAGGGSQQAGKAQQAQSQTGVPTGVDDPLGDFLNNIDHYTSAKAKATDMMLAELGKTSATNPATSNTSIPDGVSVPNSELTEAQSKALINSIKDGLAQRNDVELLAARWPTSGTGGLEKDLYAATHKLANDIDGYLTGVGGVASLATNQQIKASIIGRMAAVESLAASYYGDAVDEIGMMKNAFVLSSYDALNRYNPDFQWTKLGIFAANEVRGGLGIAYSAKNAFELAAVLYPNKMIGDMTLGQAARASGAAATMLLDGQMAVLSDVGALALMHKQFGAEVMSQQPWLKDESRVGFTYQVRAESARAEGNSVAWRKWQTEAAIQFGIHEQKHLLQPMWDKSMMKNFATVNNWMLENANLGLRGHIHIGVNKFDGSGGYKIEAPLAATNLWKVDDRIAIARNGFEQLQQLQSNPAAARWIDRSQNLLGNSIGIYRPLGWKRFGS